jgi:hypothetical protein
VGSIPTLGTSRTIFYQLLTSFGDFDDFGRNPSKMAHLAETLPVKADFFDTEENLQKNMWLRINIANIFTISNLFLGHQQNPVRVR